MNISNKDMFMAYKAGAVEVIKHKNQLNKINVFPVPDGDTGSNMTSLMRMILSSAVLGDTVDMTLSSIAEAALMGARGNSGIIFAQYMTGLSMSVTRGAVSISMNEFAIANNLAVKKAYEAVEEPVEGTMLTLIKAFSEAISERFNHNRQMDVSHLDDVVKVMDVALLETKEQLPVLKKAEVVDAGAKGFFHFIEGFIRFLISPKEVDETMFELEDVAYDEPILHEGEIHYRYCTEALVKQLDIEIDGLKELLHPYGDSFIVAGNELLFRLHIHTNTPAKVFEILREHGTVAFQKADDMIAQNILVKKPKYKIGLITDSIADIPLSYIDLYQIQVIPLDILYKHETFVDRLTVTNSEVLYYDGLGKERPTSSQPDLIKIKELYNRMKGHYEKVLVLPVAKALSGTYNAFVKAREGICDENFQVTVMDTKENSAAQGLIVYEAAQMIDQGYAIETIVERIERVIEKSKIYVGVKNIDAMIRSGRLSTKGGAVAKAINLKPIVTLKETGEGGLAGIAFSFEGNVKNILKKLKKDHQQRTITKYCVVHINNPSKADEFAREIEKVLGVPPLYIEEVSSVIAIGAGDGAVAVGYIAEK